MGRKRLYLDNADRQAAYRERKARKDALGEMYRVLCEKPTERLIGILIGRYLDQAEDRRQAEARLRMTISDVIEAGNRYENSATLTG